MFKVRRPSPSMIVALIALVVALGGTAFAAGVVINGNLLKNGSVTGKKLKKDTLTGREIKESKLGKVPSARNADRAKRADLATLATNATNATKASTLGGLAASGFVQGSGQVFTAFKAVPFGTSSDIPVFDVPGVGTAIADCDASGNLSFSLRNGTGQNIDEVTVTSAMPAPLAPIGGGTLPPNGFVAAQTAVQTGQDHVQLMWPSGTSTHAVDMTIGFHKDGLTSTCRLYVSGIAR